MNLVDRVNQAAKELGMDGSVVDLADRLMNDQRPRLEDAYLFANTSDNEQSLFQAARQMRLEGLASMFWIIDGTDAYGFPGYRKWHGRAGRAVGYDNWLELLTGKLLGYNKHIKAVPIQNRRGVNTMNESQALVDFAEKEGRRFWYAVAPEFHLVRAYMTLVSEILHSGQDISVFSFPGAPLPWDEVVRHSQGRTVDTRANLLAVHEMDRIKKYPNLLPARDILGYMDGRALPQPLNSGGLER